jgi:hypothetical protein
MKLLKKIDQFLFDNISKVVVLWVKKQGGKKHKYDFFLKLQSWKIYIWLPVMAYQPAVAFYAHKLPAYKILFLMGPMLLMIGLELFLYRILLEQKQDYDILFARRKDPIVYQAVKETCAWLWEKRASSRQKALSLQMVAMVFFAVFNWPVTIIYIILIISLYETFIFDFDDPDKKEKKKTEPLTETMLNAWKNLIGALAPGNA